MSFYSLPITLDHDIEIFAEILARHLKGEISASELKARRVPFGIYEQRIAGAYMMRVRCPAGCITPEQLEKVAELSEKFGNGLLHITTRQEIQLHDIKLNDFITIIKELKLAGLASQGGGGNTVRNIVAPDDSGIDPDEIFDVTPYALELTNRLIAENDSWNLPRKYKIAFSGSNKDKAYATLTDLGFISQKKHNEKGFRVYIAGGLGAKPQVGKLLFDFIPEGEVYNIAKAVKNLFWKYGNRKNKHAARLRFLWQTLGEELFKERFFIEYTAVKAEKFPVLNVEKNTTLYFPNEKLFIENPDDKNDFERWQKRYVMSQKTKGLYSVLISIELGFITSDLTRRFADLIQNAGIHLRMTKEQNFLLRDVPVNLLGNIYNFLRKNYGNYNEPLVCSNIISCAGASTCQLGICNSRQAAKELLQRLKLVKTDIDTSIKINISGCPNSCGQHPVAELGFFGKAARHNNILYPAYNVVVGAVVGDGITQFAETIGEIAAKDLPVFVEECLQTFQHKSEIFTNFGDFVRGIGKDEIRKLCEKYRSIPSIEANKDYYIDWGSDKQFSLAERGAGECSSGMFDLIEIDLKNVRQLVSQVTVSTNEKKKDLLHDLIFHSSRMLLSARGVEPRNEAEVYENFKKHFIDTGLIDPQLNELINYAMKKDLETLLSKEQKALDLAKNVEFLYSNMDNAFNFNVPIYQTINPGCNDFSAKHKKDLRGIACPMNFVKTKIELAKLSSGEKLEILLDDGAPIENVPGSLKSEGHKILQQEKEGEHWKVVIEKA